MSEDRDYEQEARAQGWVPEEEFRGGNPPEKFVDAQTYVERGEKSAGILKSKLESIESELNTVKRSNAEFKAYHDKQIAKERAQREALIKELEEVRAAAVEEGDGKKFAQADRELSELKAPPEVEDPNARRWLSENGWYNTNEKLAAFADGIAERIISEGYNGQAYFNELTRRVKETFPDEFKSDPKPPSPESGQDREASNPKPKSYEALPVEARAQCDLFVKQGFITKEQYIADYDWD